MVTLTGVAADYTGAESPADRHHSERWPLSPFATSTTLIERRHM